MGDTAVRAVADAAIRQFCPAHEEENTEKESDKAVCP